jgi:redox-sensitive bicupin YhaK (pirin superfamily)
VTVVRRGFIDHADSLGAAARYGAGDVQWLTAGGGVVHSEMFPLLNRNGPNPLELFQIWLNLPSADKLAAPHFSMLWSEVVPKHVANDEEGRPVEVTVVAGRLGDVKAPAPPPRSWAARPDSDVAIWTVKLAPGARWTLPAAATRSNRRLYFFRGTELRVDGQAIIPASHSIDLRADAAVQLEASRDEVELLLLQGKPIDEPVVQYGPFVMTNRGEIQQAIEDYRRTRFGGWPWESDEPVHPRDAGRFARDTDGRVERPG